MLRLNSGVLLLFCMAASSTGRPLKPGRVSEATAMHQVLQPKGQLMSMDPAGTPIVLQTAAGPEQMQIAPGFNFIPLPAMVPQQPGMAGSPFLPTTQLNVPLADTEEQPQIYTVIIRQPLPSGSASSEEVAQPPIIYSGVLVPVYAAGQNMGLLNKDIENAETEGVPPNPDPAPQENSPAPQTPAGVQLETGHVEKSAPCAGEGAPAAGNQQLLPTVPPQSTTITFLPVKGDPTVRSASGTPRVNSGVHRGDIM